MNFFILPDHYSLISNDLRNKVEPRRLKTGEWAYPEDLLNWDWVSSTYKSLFDGLTAEELDADEFYDPLEDEPQEE